MTATESSKSIKQNMKLETTPKSQKQGVTLVLKRPKRGKTSDDALKLLEQQTNGPWKASNIQLKGTSNYHSSFATEWKEYYKQETTPPPKIQRYRTILLRTTCSSL